jgi:hypothetical protein
MSTSSPIWSFTLCVLAVWRLTHLLAKEDGPWDLIVRIRKALGESFIGRLMDCFYCLTLWLSLAPAILLGRDWIMRFLFWFALSGAVCLVEKSTVHKDPEVPAIQFLEGEPSCAAVKNEMP